MRMLVYRERSYPAREVQGRDGSYTVAADSLVPPEVILKAIEDYHRVPSFGAKRRQLQLIGKYMRALDGDAVRQAIDRATGNDKAAVAALHRVNV